MTLALQLLIVAGLFIWFSPGRNATRAAAKARANEGNPFVFKSAAVVGEISFNTPNVWTRITVAAVELSFLRRDPIRVARDQVTLVEPVKYWLYRGYRFELTSDAPVNRLAIWAGPDFAAALRELNWPLSETEPRRIRAGWPGGRGGDSFDIG